MEKLCVFCKHLTLYEGWYSPDSSYGDCGTVECEKRHWEIILNGFDDEFREKILQAETCPDYDQA